MISDKDFELICNYKKQEVNSSRVELYCIDMIEENNKQIMRDLAINSILSNDKEKDDAYNNYRSIINHNSELPVISPKVIKETIFKQKYNHISDIYDHITQDLDRNSNGGDIVQITNQNFLTSEENLNANSRRIVTKIIYKCNKVHAEARIPVNCIIVGSNLINYLDNNSYFYKNNSDTSIGSITSINVILNYNINPNKVIILANSKNLSNGINLIVDEKNNEFFYAKLPSSSWSKNIDFFEIQ